MKYSPLIILFSVLLIIFGCNTNRETASNLGSIVSFKNDLKSLKSRAFKVKKLGINNLTSTEFPSVDLVEFKNLENLILNNTTGKNLEPTHYIIDFDKETLESLHSLKSISIIGIGLEKFPLELSSIPNLESLTIVGANLDSLPSDLSKFKSLTYLDLSINKIRKLPENITTVNPIDLRIPNNLIQSIPEYFLKDSRLTNLDVSNREGTMSFLPTNQISSRDKQKLFQLLKDGKTEVLTIQNLTCTDYESLKEILLTREDQKRIRIIEGKDCKKRSSIKG